MPNPSPSSAEPGKTPAGPGPQEDEGGLLPAVLVGGAILAVVAALVFWPTDDGGAKGASRAKADGTRVAAAEGGRRGVPAGGVQSREVDDPSRRAPNPRINPKVRLPQGAGIKPGPPPEPEAPPEFENSEEEVAWYQAKLERAVANRDKRKVFAERLPKVRERIEQGENAEKQLEAFEGRKKIVEENLAKAEKEVEELEAKLAELRKE